MRHEHPNFYVETAWERRQKFVASLTDEQILMLGVLMSWATGYGPMKDPKVVRFVLTNANDEIRESSLTPDFEEQYRKDMEAIERNKALHTSP
jgi:hypothetical protein